MFNLSLSLNSSSAPLGKVIDASTFVNGTPFDMSAYLPAGRRLVQPQVKEVTVGAVTITLTVTGDAEITPTWTGSILLEGVSIRVAFETEAQPTAFTFGADTRAGMGGLAAPVGATAISGGTATGYTLSGGYVAPTSNGSATAGTIVFDNAVTWTVTTVADAMDVRTAAEFIALMDRPATNSAVMSGKSVRFRPGSYALLPAVVSGGWNGAFNGLTAPVTLTSTNAADQDEWASIDGMMFTNTGGYPAADITWTKLRIYRPRTFTFAAGANINALDDNEERGVYIQSVGNTSAFIFDDILAESDMPVAGQGDKANSMFTAIVSRASANNISVINSTFRNVGIGVALAGDNITIENNLFDGIYDDAIELGDGTVGGVMDGLSVKNNAIIRYIGSNAFLHSDHIQFNDWLELRNAEIAGNVFICGDIQSNAEGVPDPGSSRDISLSASATLTVADHGNRRVTVSAAGVTLTLPAAAAATDTTFHVRPTGGTVTVAAAPGEDGDFTFPLALGNGGVYMIRSDGAAWRRAPEGIVNQQNYVTGDLTLAQHHSGTTGAGNGLPPQMWFDATAGMRTATLPDVDTVDPAVSAWSFVVGKFDKSANVVRLIAQAGQVIDLDGVEAQTHDLGRVTENVLLTKKAAGKWTAARTPPTVQGIFGNPASFENVRIHGNIVMANSANGISVTAADASHLDFAELRVWNNTVLAPYPEPTFSGEAHPTVEDGWKNVPAVIRAVSAARNVSQGINDVDGPANVSLNITASSVLPSTHFAPTTRAGYYPLTRAAAIAAARPKAGGPLDGTWIGAIGATDADGYWNHTTGQPNTGGPAPLIVTREPAVGADHLPDRNITLEFDQWITKGTGTIQLWNEDTDSLIEDFDAATSARLTWTEDTLVIDPTSDLPTATVSLRIPNTAIDGMYGTAFAGLSGAAYSFESKPGYFDLAGSFKDFSQSYWRMSGGGVKTFVTDGWALMTNSSYLDTGVAPVWTLPAPYTPASLSGLRLTGVVDVADYNASPNRTPNMKFQCTGATTVDPTIIYYFATSTLGLADETLPGGDYGVISMPNGVKRLWVRFTAPASVTRVFCQANRFGDSGGIYSRPCLFVGEPSVADITSLPESLPPPAP